MNKFIIILAFITTLVSCNKNEEIIILEDNLLIGNWSEVTYDNDLITFKRVFELPQNAYGFSFRSEFPNFTERTSGWCGTPPLTFFNVNGNWEVKGDILNIYDVNTPNVQGASPVLLYSFRIVSLTNEALSLKREITDQEKDYQKLMEAYDDFYNMIAGKTCTDESEWSFVGYGAKACGGFQGFIPYPNTIDEAVFLEKVAVYTQLEEEYNTKWSIISTCDIVVEPEGVVCENGLPKLKY